MVPLDSRNARRWLTLLCAILYYDASVMVWVLPGALREALAAAFRLTPGQMSLAAITPVAAGALFLPVLGLLGDRYGARRTALGGLTLTASALLMAWLWASTLPQLVAVGVLLGVAGGSFAVALPMASRWFSGESQGTVLGITGMGSGGMALATYLAAHYVPAVGWRGIFGIALIPVAAALVLVLLAAREVPAAPVRRRWGDGLGILARRDLYWCGGFYAVTFGGFLGLLSSLPVYYRDQYGVDPSRAAIFAAVCAVVGSVARPLGGYLADRLGGVLLLFLLLIGVGFLGMRMSYLPHLEVATLSLFLILVLLAMGNGALFQVVPQRFGDGLGLATGMIGAVGVAAGVLLPMALGYAKQATGRFGPGFFLIGMAGFTAAGLLIQASRDWQGAPEVGGSRSRRAGIGREGSPALAEAGNGSMRG
jgi:MFS transporter, NNP family, nitrate/nitrite transporter